ncbi:DoxX family protein [Mesorhizobium sp. VK23B]|uniref:DoxX family protein n=2 Tax=Mesorhizobium dulcispinae TaxID=3072316 RepID=A0ABU4XAY7_9HYPH|nr:MULTISPECIES: DoxX family protein [unclassified Mesorhizobium]MDX8466145.1 DoxX family protein [Mesorhizobium sp. VK23B]MDX8471956.1 DoxX family protein [Mesorhizobium sp. VK23A]
MSAPELIQTLTRRLSSIAMAVAPIFLRAALAVPFFRSGLTRWDGFLQISDSTTYLFEEEFKLHLFGAEYGFPMPDAVAYLVATAELTLPVLLVLGLATRFAALAMLIMTGVIQLVVPDGWANFHLPWAAMAISIIALGAGPISLDRLIALRFASEAYRQ